MAFTAANLAAKLAVMVTADTKDAEKGLTGVTDKMNSLGNKAIGLGAGLTAGVTAPLVGLGMAAIGAASDLEESMSKVGVVFGDASEEVEDFASTAATSLGMSEQAALEATGTYGNLLRAMGLTSEESADMSTSLVTLAADLASFNNIDPTVALEKLRAGLTGETEPLKTLGINMNQARLEAKALELGLISAGETMDAAAKAQAAYAIMVEDTALAQGDFARTSDGLANSSRILKAQLQDVSAELGEKLLPVAIRLVGGLNDLVSAFVAMPEPIQNAVVVLAGVAAAAGPITTVVGVVLKLGAVLGGVFGAGGALAGAGAFITGTIIPALTGLGGALAAIATGPVLLLGAAIAALVIVIKTMGPAALDSLKMLAEIFKIKIAEAMNTLRQFGIDLSQRLREWAADMLRGAQDIGKNIVDGIWKGIQSGWSWLTNKVKELANSLLDAAKNALGISSPSKLFAMEIGAPSAAGILSGFQSAMDGVQSGISSSLGGITGNISGQATATGGAPTGLMDQLQVAEATNTGAGGKQQINIYLGNDLLGKYTLDAVGNAVSV